MVLGPLGGLGSPWERLGGLRGRLGLSLASLGCVLWASWGRLGDVWAYVQRSFRTSIVCNLGIVSKLISISDKADVSIGFHADSDVFNQGGI